MPLLALAAILALGFPLTASAHTTGPGAQAFLSGFLHPFIVPQHLLVLVGLAVLYTQRQRASRKTSLAFVVPALVVGLTITTIWQGIGVLPLVLVICAAAVGVIVALARPLPPVFDIALTVIILLLIGLDSAQESASRLEVFAALAGVVVAIYAFLFDVPHYLNIYKPPWTNIGLRVVGSWIAAISFILFAFYAKGMMH